MKNLFLLLRARLVLSEYGVRKLSKNGMSYIFDFVDGIDGARIKSFLERFDARKAMVLLSLKKIRVETRYWRSIEEFLEEMTKR